MGIIRNLNNDSKNQVENSVKKFIKKRLKKIGTIILLIIFLLLFLLGIFDLGIELFTAQNNPQLVYDTFEIEDLAELVEIKEDGNGGYYLDFIDDFDEKLSDIIDEMRKSGEYHELTNNEELLKKMIKAEVYTQFPDLGGTVPSDSTDGFQGAVQIRRVTPNKDPGAMENTGRGETSSLEQEEVNEPTPVEDRNDSNRLNSWTKGQRLKIIPVDTPIYESIQGYWQPMLQEGSQTNQIKLQRGDVVTYQGEYTIHNNGLSGTQTIYVKILTDDRN